MNDNYYNRLFTSSMPKAIETLDEYHGEKDVVLACTQLSEIIYPKQSQQKKIQTIGLIFYG